MIMYIEDPKESMQKMSEYLNLARFLDTGSIYKNSLNRNFYISNNELKVQLKERPNCIVGKVLESKNLAVVFSNVQEEKDKDTSGHIVQLADFVKACSKLTPSSAPQSPFCIFRCFIIQYLAFAVLLTLFSAFS